MNLKTIFSSKNAKIVLENFVSLSALQIINYLLPLLTIPYLARVIGVERIGEIAFANTVMIYFQTIVDYGFVYTGTRDVVKNRDNIENINQIFSAVILSKILLCVISFLLLISLIIFIPLFQEKKVLLLLTFSLIPSYILYPDWLFQGLEKMKYITIFNVIIRVLFTSLIFIFIKQETDYIMYPIFLSVSYFFSSILSLYYIRYKFNIRFRFLPIKKIIETLKNGFNIFINQLFPNLYNSFSVLLLGFWGGNFSNGIYDAGSKFINVAQQMFNVFSRVFFPYLNRNVHNHQKYAKLILGLSSIVSLNLFIFAPLIINIFYTAEFNASIAVLRILSFSPLFLALSDIYGTNYLIVLGYDKLIRNITFICSMFGFCIAFPLVYFYSYIGVAIAIVSTRALLGIITLIFAKLKKNENSFA